MKAVEKNLWKMCEVRSPESASRNFTLVSPGLARIRWEGATQCTLGRHPWTCNGSISCTLPKYVDEGVLHAAHLVHKYPKRLRSLMVDHLLMWCEKGEFGPSGVHRPLLLTYL